MFGGANSNVANNSTPANANANTAPAAKNEDLPMLAAPKLVEMLMADTAGLNARLKDQEIIVIGELNTTSNGDVMLSGGPLRDINCTHPPGGDPKMGWPENYKRLESLTPGAKKPIVEVRGVFTKGTVETTEGLRYVSIFLEKCTIVSIK